MSSEHPNSQSKKGDVRPPGQSLWGGERQKELDPNSNCPCAHPRDKGQGVVLMSPVLPVPELLRSFMQAMASLPEHSAPALEPSTKLVLKRQVRFSNLLYTKGQQLIFLTMLLHGTRIPNWKRKCVTWQDVSGLGPCPSVQVSQLRWT